LNAPTWIHHVPPDSAATTGFAGAERVGASTAGAARTGVATRSGRGSEATRGEAVGRLGRSAGGAGVATVGAALGAGTTAGVLGAGFGVGASREVVAGGAGVGAGTAGAGDLTAGGTTGSLRPAVRDGADGSNQLSMYGMETTMTIANTVRTSTARNQPAAKMLRGPNSSRSSSSS
jgi:hypothetical protein